MALCPKNGFAPLSYVDLKDKLVPTLNTCLAPSSYTFENLNLLLPNSYSRKIPYVHMCMLQMKPYIHEAIQLRKVNVKLYLYNTIMYVD